MAFSVYLAGQLIGHVYGGAAYAQPTAWTLDASTTVVNSDGTGITVPSDVAYAAQSLAAADWTRSGNQASNANDIVFPQASVDWGTIVAFALKDGAGNLLAPMSESSGGVSVLANQQLRIPAGSLVITFTT